MTWYVPAVFVMLLVLLFAANWGRFFGPGSRTPATSDWLGDVSEPDYPPPVPHTSSGGEHGTQSLAGLPGLEHQIGPASHYPVPGSHRPVFGSSPIPINDIVRILISFAVLASALYVILSGNYVDGDKNWAFGAVGALIGFWLKGPTT